MAIALELINNIQNNEGYKRPYEYSAVNRRL